MWGRYTNYTECADSYDAYVRAFLQVFNSLQIISFSFTKQAKTAGFNEKVITKCCPCVSGGTHKAGKPNAVHSLSWQPLFRALS